MKKSVLRFLIILAIGLIGILLFFLFKNQKTISLKNYVSTDAIIQAALNIELPPTDNIVSQEAYGLSKQASQKVSESQYDIAIDIIVGGLNKIPQNFTLQADLAYLLSDCAEVGAPELLSIDLKNKMMQRSDQIFNKLMVEVKKQPKAEIYRFKNEYFYHFRMHREQYELGVQRVSDYWGTVDWMTSGFRGYYSQGVGAARYAQQLIARGDRQLALDYAQKAIIAWAQYFSYKNDYYNAYVHYALALGILGYKEEMMRALEKSASLIRRDLNYFEFKNVIDFVRGLEKK
jgi:hypothetical protein